MELPFSYVRKFISSRRCDRIVDLGDAGSFNAVVSRMPRSPEETAVAGRRFSAIHIIDSMIGGRVFTAYRSEEHPEVLLVVWKGFPYNIEIEEGGDMMLQVMQDDPRITCLLIDNTWVRSGWMNPAMVEYLDNGWMPGLTWCGLRIFCHLQSASYLGGNSFEQFGATLNGVIAGIGRRLGREPFRYHAIRTSELSDDGSIDDAIREAGFAEAFRIFDSRKG
jgi:hypothetical protein